MLSNNKPENMMTLPAGPLKKEGGLDYETLKEVVTENVKSDYQYSTEELVVDDMNYVAGLGEKASNTFWGTLGYKTEYSVSENYGVKFKSAQQSLENLQTDTNEMNILFMGTGGTLHFGGKHKDVYEGGDVLCHLGLHKGVDDHTPTLLLRGVGTANFTSASDFYDEAGKNKPTAGSANEGIQGTGVKLRLAIAMEQFFIPTLLQMVNKKIKQGSLEKPNKDCELTFNIVGHSRGAITSYAMADLIDVFMKDIIKLNPKELEVLANSIAEQFEKATASKENGIKKSLEKSLSKEDILEAFVAIQKKSIRFKTKMMIYDPVEGRAGFGDYYTSSFSLPLYGKSYSCTYSGIPESVKEAQIFVAYDERRIDFQPTISMPDNKQETNLRVVPVLGVHGTLKGYFSVFNDLGQDSYTTVKNSTFLKEALRASADLVKVKSTKFLFDTLPPFDTVTLYNAMYSNTVKGYPRTKKNLLAEIEKWINNPNKDFIEKLSQLGVGINIESIKEKGLGEVLTHQQLISLCTWVMQKNPELTKRLYHDLERDVYSEFLSPTSKKKAKLLQSLRNEMRNDIWNVGINMSNQTSDDSRMIWHRDKKSVSQKSTMDNSYPELTYNPVSLLWYPQSQGIGRSAEDYIHDPFYFNLFDFISSEKQQLLSNEEFEDLELIAYEIANLNEAGTVLAFNQNAKSLNNYLKIREHVLNKLGDSNIAEDLKISIAGFLRCKEEFQFRIPEKNQFSTFHSKVNNRSVNKIDEVIVSALQYHADNALALINDVQIEDYILLYLEVNRMLNHIHKESIQLPKEVEAKFKKLSDLNNSKGQPRVTVYLAEELLFLSNFTNDYKTRKLYAEESDITRCKKSIAELQIKLKTENLTKDDHKRIENAIEKENKNIKTAEQNIIEINKMHKDFVAILSKLTAKLDQAKSMDELDSIYSEVNALAKGKQGVTVSDQYKNLLYQISEKQNDRKKLQHAKCDRYRSIKKAKSITTSYSNVSKKENIIPIDKSRVNELIVLINNYKKEPNVLQILLDAVKNEDVKAVSEYLEASKGTGLTGTSFDISLSSQRDSEGNSVLHLIAKSGNPALWEIVDKSGYTAGYTRATTYNPEHIFKNFSTPNNAGETPLDVAIKAGNLEVVKSMRKIYQRIDHKKYSDKVFDAYELSARTNVPKSKKSQPHK